MRPIQFILILGLLTSLVVYRRAFRSTLRDRILVLGFLGSGLLAVLFPDYTSTVAEFLGVGRGSDLVMYLFLVAAVFFAILFHAKLSRIEHAQTEIIRFLAISTVRLPVSREPPAHQNPPAPGTQPAPEVHRALRRQSQHNRTNRPHPSPGQRDGQATLEFHLQRYRFAGRVFQARPAAGYRLRSGLWPRLLAVEGDGVAEVVGVDVAEREIDHASRHYGRSDGPVPPT